MESKIIKLSSFVTNIRIDKLISEIFDYSRSYISKIINDGNILVNNKNIKPSYLLKKRDLVTICITPPKTLNLEAQPIEIDIIFQDEHIAVINKPAGMVVHPSAGHYDNTLVNALLYHCKDLSGINDILRPGIVHRLDKDTSGLIVIAKNDKAHLNLAKQFKDRQVKKFYKALVHGIVKPDSGRIENFIGRHKKNRLKFSSFTSSGKLAITNYKVEKYFGNMTLLDINIETGRTHQIRVHFSEKGHPLVGDTLYGNKKLNKKTDISRVFLHSYKIIFKHPVLDKDLNFAIELPGELRNFLEKIK